MGQYATLAGCGKFSYRKLKIRGLERAQSRNAVETSIEKMDTRVEALLDASCALYC